MIASTSVRIPAPPGRYHTSRNCARFARLDSLVELEAQRLADAHSQVRLFAYRRGDRPAHMGRKKVHVHQVKKLFFRFKTPLWPTLAVLLERENPVSIRQALLKYLPEDLTGEEPTADQISRLVKL